MSQVNLLPPEIRERQKVRQRTVLVGIIGAGIVLLVLAFYFLQSFNLAKANEDLEAQQQQNAQLASAGAELQEFADLQAELAEKQELAARSSRARSPGRGSSWTSPGSCRRKRC